jgi:hypothetical protein
MVSAFEVSFRAKTFIHSKKGQCVSECCFFNQKQSAR